MGVKSGNGRGGEEFALENQHQNREEKKTSVEKLLALLYDDDIQGAVGQHNGVFIIRVRM